MGRNDLCFCMSGKKQIKCHPGIDEGSQEAAKLRIYGQLNKELEKQSQISEGITLCVPGCIHCCYDYFTVQSIEFRLILDELAKWSEEELNNLIEKVDKNWNILVEGHPEVRNFLLKTNNRDIDEINSLVDKTSFPCIFLDDNTNLCKIYDVRPFKCRIFGNTYYYPQDEGGVAIVCHRYGRVINEDNFDLILYDVTELLDKNTDLSIIHDKSGNMPFLSPEYPLIYYLYQHFIVS